MILGRKLVALTFFSSLELRSANDASERIRKGLASEYGI